MKSFLSILFSLTMVLFSTCKSTSRPTSDVQAPSELVEPEILKTDLVDASLDPAELSSKTAEVEKLTPAEKPTASDNPIPTNEAPAINRAKFVPQLCTMEFNPTRCHYRNFKTKTIIEFDRIYGWGNNACAAKNNLGMNVELKKLNENDFSDMICNPDSSQGLCSQIKRSCPQASPSEHLSCHLKAYKNKKFLPHEMIYVAGHSTCEARVEIEEELCRKNLYYQTVNESALTCESFVDPLDCNSAEPATCANEYKPAVCVMNNTELSNDENAIFDRNECFSREILKHKLCLRGFEKKFLESKNLFCE